MSDQWGADGLATAEEDVEHTGWQHALGQLAQTQRGQRRQFGRFDHHGVTGCQRGCDLPGQHHQRVVPRRDRGDHAQRVAADHRGVPRQVLAGRRAAQAARRAGEKAEDIGDRRDFVIQRSAVGLATILRFEPGQFLAMLLDGVGQCQQCLGAVLGAGLRPAVEGQIGGAHGAVDLRFGGFVNLRQGAAQGGVEYGPGWPVASDQMTVDQHVRLHGGLLQGHLPLPATLSPPRVR
ncbi:hypothetical protein D3C81_1454840 [compost metagenome]